MGRAARVPPSARWLVVVLVAGVVLVASVLPRSTGVAPPPGPGPVGVGVDEWLHALSYAGLAGALLYALATTGRSTLVVATSVVGLAVAFGLAVELFQAPLPTRRFEPLDAAANAVGATVAVAVWWAAAELLEARAAGGTS